MTDADVLRDEPQEPVVPDKGQGQDDKVTLSRAELDSIRRERDEARESERYWANQARGGGRQAEPAAQAVDDGPDPNEFLDTEERPAGLDGDTPEKLIDEFASQGVAALSKRGFITASDAKRIAVEAALHVSQELIGRERQKMGTDAQIKSEFPDLWNKDSDLFRETAVRYQKAVAMDPNATKSPAALWLAAEAARESLKRSGRDTQRDEEDDYPRERRGEREDDRRARAASQDSRSNGRQQIEDIDMLGPEAKQVAKLMGISDKEFRDSRKELGVRPRRR
jgi:hypothetical protein